MPLSAKSAINMHLGIGGIITKLGIEKRRNVKHAFKFMDTDGVADSSVGRRISSVDRVQT